MPDNNVASSSKESEAGSGPRTTWNDYFMQRVATGGRLTHAHE